MQLQHRRLVHTTFLCGERLQIMENDKKYSVTVFEILLISANSKTKTLMADFTKGVNGKPDEPVVVHWRPKK